MPEKRSGRLEELRVGGVVVLEDVLGETRRTVGVERDGARDVTVGAGVRLRLDGEGRYVDDRVGLVIVGDLVVDGLGV